MKTLLFFAGLCFLVAAQAQVIQFAVSQSVPSPSTPAFAISNNGNMTYEFNFPQFRIHIELTSVDFRRSEGLYAFMRWYNASGRPVVQADGINYTLSLRVDTNNYTSASVQASYRRLVNTTSPVFLFAPFGTPQAQYAANVTEPQNRMLVSTTASSSVWNSGYKLAFSTWPTFTSCVLLPYAN